MYFLAHGKQGGKKTIVVVIADDKSKDEQVSYFAFVRMGGQYRPISFGAPDNLAEAKRLSEGMGIQESDWKRFASLAGLRAATRGADSEFIIKMVEHFAK